MREALEGNVLLERGEEDEDNSPTPLPGPATDAAVRSSEPQVDWDSAVAGAATDNGWDDDEGSQERSERGGQSLKEYLLWQLELARMSARDAGIGAAVIDALNDDGYLTEPLEDLRQSLADSDEAPEPDEMYAVLHRIQAFDPPGIAARDLKECLLLQLRQTDKATAGHALATALVTSHLEALAAHEHERLCRLLGFSRAELDVALELIVSLNPRPGAAIAGNQVDYVLPDVLVHRRGAGWAVELNPDAVPKVRVNAAYAAALRRGDSAGSLSQQLQEARWLRYTADIDSANMPLQYGVELVAYLVNQESGRQKFMRGVMTVGGRTHIGIITKAAGFRELNKPELEHKHIGYHRD